MAVFDPYAARTARKPSEVRLTLTVKQPSSAAGTQGRTYEGAIDFQIMSNEADPANQVELDRRHDNLVPLLNPTQQGQMQAIMDAAMNAARSGPVP